MTAGYFSIGTPAQTIPCDLFKILTTPPVTELLYKPEVALTNLKLHVSVGVNAGNALQQ